ncbi:MULTISPECIES: adenosylcobinamide-phosphate synthase CbiB [unclassified Undibacterium]|uniref:adenosylcobinamide-phosphate synthase CbiB n=1 Tax=unclassified Undibacterium TaxID=2630295 RepID=UPI002AC8F022|nr:MULTISPECIES: adenosylcobinamide-phosphate synthase CbiB [unclassified Undibacterium]MEB0139079.1 adenosylcobinamide-phosphate synthase CbiB [Undibacterium sp. CCC2.1]MEB0172964.1 adenosylcobinamide-phosphate synthase CbiB [Undibacterium sp. CCC1.1]MEB0177286.1 adenosylcobinamide-phosphate synthase CbiB [Undibacterium sp. CCC3.4]MEB0215882.1 adenosylcobinamide-phosphate synthase CbiB [Undibacterium sp. 5I2]WPX45653.1 adenosylcobinamide-phosphate synthase CbiB [Undibacterium sp. CCC3.4]
MLSGMLVLAALLLGLLLDSCFGEVRRWHPLVGFGSLAQRLEQRWNRPAAGRWRGACAWALLVLPPVLALQAALWALARYSVFLAVLAHALLLYFCLGLRSLKEHNLPIQAALEQDDLATARRLTSYIVSRDTGHADAASLAKASVESLLENGADAVFASVFWFLLLGGAGAVLHRLTNTLDAMWGYRSERWLRFGCVAARSDDVLNWVPARLTALSYAVLGDTKLALQCWRRQAPAWDSPNAGPVMAAGAGALGVQLGGRARYDGIDEIRPPLGQGRAALAADITRAWQLVRAVLYLWCGALSLLALGRVLFTVGINYA